MSLDKVLPLTRAEVRELSCLLVKLATSGNATVKRTAVEWIKKLDNEDNFVTPGKE